MCPELEFNMSTGRDCFALPSVVLYLQAGGHSCFIYFSVSMTVGLQFVRLSSALKPIQDFASHVKRCRNPVIFNVKLHNSNAITSSKKLHDRVTFPQFVHEFNLWPDFHSDSLSPRGCHVPYFSILSLVRGSRQSKEGK